MRSNMASSIWHRTWHRAWLEHVVMLGHATSTSTSNLHSHVLAYVLVLLRVEGKPQRVRSAEGQIGLRRRDLNSRVTEEHWRARVRDRHQLVDYHRLLGAGLRLGCDRPFCRSYRRRGILFISTRSFASTSDTEAL